MTTSHLERISQTRGHLPHEQEEIGLVLDSIQELHDVLAKNDRQHETNPSLLNHIRHRLHSSVLIITSKIVQDAERSHFSSSKLDQLE